jgi:hypothetical protein
MSDDANERWIIPVEDCWQEPGCPCERCVTTKWRLDNNRRVMAREAERRAEQAVEAERKAAQRPVA